MIHQSERVRSWLRRFISNRIRGTEVIGMLAAKHIGGVAATCLLVSTSSATPGQRYWPPVDLNVNSRVTYLISLGDPIYRCPLDALHH